jgi:hypothetical protein
VTALGERRRGRNALPPSGIESFGTGSRAAIRFWTRIGPL